LISGRRWAIPYNARANSSWKVYASIDDIKTRELIIEQACELRQFASIVNTAQGAG
jgi:hypothetical protein